METFEFEQGSAHLRSAHRALVAALARRMIADEVEGVRLIAGQGGDPDAVIGRALGVARGQAVAGALRQELQRAMPGSERRVDIEVVSRALAGECDRDVDRVIVHFQAGAPLMTRVFRVTATSIVETHDDDSPESGFFASRPRENDSFRLFSRAGVRVVHRGARLVSVSTVNGVSTGSQQAKPSRPEASLSLPQVTLSAPFATTRVDESRARFHWCIKRRLSKGTRAGCPESGESCAPFSVYRVEGIVDASSGSPHITLVQVVGSDVCSHRVWVDGVLRHVTEGDAPLRRVMAGEAGADRVA